MSREFSAALTDRIAALAGRYPMKQAALLPVLRLVQDEMGHITPGDERLVAALLEIPVMKVHEALTFYTMFRRAPLGRYHLQVCTNVSCSLAGADKLVDHLQARLGIKLGETTHDGKYTLTGVECLGACEQGPCMMVNFEYHGNLDFAKLDDLIWGLP
jgi:NADH-quinone oxidoreductase subunit E